uniref:E2 ubiquitin-conjugating enzyme n=1 Tax=Rhizochromulina marina TaxID=1034831 RepID=A0A7S2STB9_9STRA
MATLGGERAVATGSVATVAMGRGLEALSAAGGQRCSDAVAVLVKILSNLIQHPEEKQYQSIKKSSKAFQFKLRAVTGCGEILWAMGFRDEVEESFPNSKALEAMVSMGFTEARAKKALLTCGMDQERAVGWVLQHTQAMDIDSLPLPPVPTVEVLKIRAVPPVEELLHVVDQLHSVVNQAKEREQRDRELLKAKATQQKKAEATAKKLTLKRWVEDEQHRDENIRSKKAPVLNSGSAEMEAQASPDRPEPAASLAALRLAHFASPPPPPPAPAAAPPSHPLPAQALTAAAGAAAASSSNSASGCRLQVRLTDGRVLRHAFAATDALSKVYVWLQQEHGAEGDLANAFPRKLLPLESFGSCQLGELDLCPSGTLLLQASSRSNDAAATEEPAVTTSDEEYRRRIWELAAPLISSGDEDEEEGADDAKAGVEHLGDEDVHKALRELLVAAEAGLAERASWKSSAGGAAATPGQTDAAGLGGRRSKRLGKELRRLADALPLSPHATIFLRFDEDHPEYMQACLTGPPETPYAHGIFVFDIFCPPAYPEIPPKVQLITTGSGSVHFSPNLYNSGYVCLSLLGTWSGPGWDPNSSTLLQVLVSIQSLILGVKHPYYNEPGFGGWEGQAGEDVGTGHVLASGAKQDFVPPDVRRFDEQVQLGNLCYAIRAALRRVKNSQQVGPGLAALCQAHLLASASDLLRTVRQWERDAERYNNPNFKRLLSTETEKLRTEISALEEGKSCGELLDLLATLPTSGAASSEMPPIGIPPTAPPDFDEDIEEDYYDDEFDDEYDMGGQSLSGGQGPPGSYKDPFDDMEDFPGTGQTLGGGASSS